MKTLLFQLEVGESGTISGIKNETGKTGLVRNLFDMGFLPGTQVTVLQKFPEQEKMIVKLGLVHLAIRKLEADLLELN
ncbi:ferrous iron transport protein A [Leptospira langatensis]|uniref:Ferrous iron transport protein A n=1 Tax=Leptospira langatensis TaxID=2484983 RepID=A0A5F1ZQM4_9LEPT|nr:FeoA family protein [Leptospira langatensis]TGK05447.1 ferrous iron transport protein A [Leptospira langatensis]TGL38583.1 ferrous iron transport protein A [Leptospira langatensis]